MKLPYYRGRSAVQQYRKQLPPWVPPACKPDTRYQQEARRILASSPCGAASVSSSPWFNVTLRRDVLTFRKGLGLYARTAKKAYKGYGALFVLYDLQRDVHALLTEEFGGKNLSELLIWGAPVTDSSTINNLTEAFSCPKPQH